MQRRDFVRLAGMACITACIPKNILADDNPAVRPNIIFIFADDQCYETLSAFGCEVETPNLDRLARNGTTFTHAYNQGAWHGAVCVASRTMLNTGRFLWHAKAIDNKKSLLEEADAGRFWGQNMAKAGYDTYMTGKWHVQVEPEKVFKTVRNVRAGMPNQTPEGYSRPIEGEVDDWCPWDPKFGGYWKGGKHWSEVLGDDSVAFIEQASKNEKPFFMYLAFNAPHDPRQSPREYVNKYPLDKVKLPENFLPEYPYKDDIGCGKGLRDEKLAPFPRTEYAVKVNRQEYYAIISHMDAQVGRILDALDKSGEKDNTYIFFTADHGLAVGHHGLIGKQNMFEHSMRPPLIVVGPDVQKNRKVDAPVYMQDLMPTTLELAGMQVPSYVQFKSFLPIIRGKRTQQYDVIYGAYMDLQRMVRNDNFKLIHYPRINKSLLFDLVKDPQEKNDLSGKPEYKTQLQKMQELLLQQQKLYHDVLLEG